MTVKKRRGRSFPRRSMTWSFLAVFMFIVSMIPARTAIAATEIRPGVDVHTPEQIRRYIDSNGVDVTTPTTYTVTPRLYDEPGEMDETSKENALKMLNNIRYVVGLSEVALDDSMGKEAQAAAFLCNSISEIINKPVITHYPANNYTKPDGMPQDVWDLGVQGCADTNLAYASWAPPMNWAVLDWMGDEDKSNIDRVGHRRWIMNPTMKKTGFGRSSGYYAMYSEDESGSNISGATMWPAQNTPREYFENDIPWSIGLGQNISGDNIYVQLVRERDGKTWNFRESDATPVNGQDYYYISNMAPYYIGRQETHLIFRPADPDIHCGDIFHVNVTGDVTMSYDVNFFSLVPVESVKIPETATLSVGASQTLKAEILPENSSERSCIWESDKPSVVTVDSKGKITGVSVGTATITATADGVSATCKVKVGIDSLTLPEEVIVAKGGTLNLKALLKVEPEDTVIVDPQWKSSDESIATVDSRGKVTGNEYGEVTITAALDGQTAKCKVKVARNIAGGRFSCADADREITYTGQPIKPNVTVTYGGKKLVEDRDYELECLNNVNANYSGSGIIYIGEVSTFRIIGKGEYGGTLGNFWTKDTYFCIVQAPIDKCSAKVDDFTYTGQAHTPEPLITYNDMTLEKGKDYTLSYSNNINAGTATILVEGKGNFNGSRTINFSIKPVDIGSDSVTVDPLRNLTYNGQEHKPGFTVKFGDYELKPAEDGTRGDYTVAYANNINAGKATATLTGQGNFTGTRTVTFAILPKSLKDCVLEKFDDVTYNGKEWTPKPSVLDGKNQLEPDKDFTVSYENNVNVGKATVTLKGIHNYTDEITGSFAIGQMDLTVKAKDMSKPYQTEDPETFTVITKPDLPEGQILVTGPVTRKPGEKIGDYPITFKSDEVKIMSTKPAMEDLTANYNITCQDGTFSIVNVDITDSEDLTISDEKATYTGDKVTIKPKVYWQGRELVVGEDVDLEFDNNVNAGDEAIVTVVGKGAGYTGKKSFHFTIEPAEIADAELKGPENPIYNGKPQTPEIKASFNGRELVPGDDENKGDYTIEYHNNINVGDKSTRAILTGHGNFTGTRTVYFSVMPLKLTEDMLEPIENVTYKAGEWTPEVVIMAGKDQIPKTDYRVSYVNNIHAGKAEFMVEAANANLEGPEKPIKGTFTIDKYPISLTAKDASKTYGEQDPEIFEVTVGQAAQGDTVNYEPAVREAGEEVGTYKISIPADSVKITNDTLGEPGMDVTGDYEITVTDGTFTIKEVPAPPADPSEDDPDNPGGGQGDGTSDQGPSATIYDPIVGESPLFNKKADEVANLITKKAGEEGPKGTTYGLLQLRASKVTGRQIKVSWKSVKGAKKYMVFASPCGKKNKYKLQLTTSKKAIAFKKISGKMLKKGVYYKFMVMAVDRNNKVIGLSKTIHVATTGKKVGNSKSVKLVKPKKKKLSLKKGKSFKVKVKAIPASKKLKVKKHRALSFETSNRKIAKVSSKGVVKGMKKGTCYLYIYAQNGVQVRVKVVVK